MNADPKPGSREWWHLDEQLGPRGAIHALLWLLEHGLITRTETYDLLVSGGLVSEGPEDALAEAPWDRLAWGVPDGHRCIARFVPAGRPMRVYLADGTELHIVGEGSLSEPVWLEQGLNARKLQETE